MELNKENLKTLQKGDIILSKDNIEYTFEALTGDIVVLMTEGLPGIHLSMPIDYLFLMGYTIKDKVEYYNGWECRSYRRDNVWVFKSNVSEGRAVNDGDVHKLKYVTKDGFFCQSGELGWKYAVQLTEYVNTKPMKVK